VPSWPRDRCGTGYRHWACPSPPTGPAAARACCDPAAGQRPCRSSPACGSWHRTHHCCLPGESDAPGCRNRRVYGTGRTRRCRARAVHCYGAHGSYCRPRRPGASCSAGKTRIRRPRRESVHPGSTAVAAVRTGGACRAARPRSGSRPGCHGGSGSARSCPPGLASPAARFGARWIHPWGKTSRPAARGRWKTHRGPGPLAGPRVRPAHVGSPARDRPRSSHRSRHSAWRNCAYPWCRPCAHRCCGTRRSGYSSSGRGRSSAGGLHGPPFRPGTGGTSAAHLRIPGVHPRRCSVPAGGRATAAAGTAAADRRRTRKPPRSPATGRLHHRYAR
jgi:hypothetical protein